MPKVATAWKEGTVTTDTTDYYLLSEASEFLITEASDFIILEDSTVTPKESTLWDEITKNATAWSPEPSGTSSAYSTNPTRITEDSLERVTEQGIVRELEDSVEGLKLPTVWDEA
jgi:hypothetical protein